jgi:hypothetical protein
MFWSSEHFPLVWSCRRCQVPLRDSRAHAWRNSLCFRPHYGFPFLHCRIFAYSPPTGLTCRCLPCCYLFFHTSFCLETNLLYSIRPYWHGRSQIFSHQIQSNFLFQQSFLGTWDVFHWKSIFQISILFSHCCLLIFKILSPHRFT